MRAILGYRGEFMFAARLREKREELGISQKDLAKQLNVSSSTVGMWERGKRNPDNDTLPKIANYFGVTVDYLLGRTDDPLGQVIFVQSIEPTTKIGQPIVYKASDLREALRKYDAGEQLSENEEKLYEMWGNQLPEMQNALSEALNRAGMPLQQAIHKVNEILATSANSIKHLINEEPGKDSVLSPGSLNYQVRALTQAKTLDQALSDYGGFMRILVASGKLTEEKAIEAVMKAVEVIEF